MKGPTLTDFGVWVAVFLAVMAPGSQLTPAILLNSQHESQIRPSVPKGEDKKDHEVEAIVDALPGMYPELGADVAIRLAESGRISDRAVKIDLLTRAYHFAESVQKPVKRDAMPGTMVDTRPGYLAMAMGMDLDRLSLQSRALNALLEVDAKQARDLFEQMELPALPPLACDEPLAYDLLLPYEVLGKLVAQGFTAKEKSEGKHIALLEKYVGGLHSHAQIIPAARLLQTVALSSADQAELTAFFSSSLERLRGDERSFTAAIGLSDGMTVLERLINQLQVKEVSSAWPLVHSLRKYLVANLSDTRCPEMVQKRSDGLPSVVVAFNKELLPSIQSVQKVQISPIRAEEIQDFRVASGPDVHAYWQSSPSRELLVGAQKLRFGSKEQPYTLEQRKEFSWTAQLADYVAALESWKPDNEDPSDFFHEKSELYAALIELVPEGPDRSKLIDSYISFLALNDFAEQSPIEWFAHVHDLIQRTHGWKETERRELLNAFLNSRDLNLSLYAHFYRWASRDETAPKPSASAMR